VICAFLSCCHLARNSLVFLFMLVSLLKSPSSLLLGANKTEANNKITSHLNRLVKYTIKKLVTLCTMPALLLEVLMQVDLLGQE